MSFRSGRTGLVSAMEEEIVEAADPAPEVLVPETTAQVETAAAEVTENTGEVEEMVAAVEEAADDAVALDDVADIMEESVEKGEGMDETAAAMAEVAVESICARLGVKKTQAVIPSLESFGSKNSRLQATRIALEGLKEKIVQIWNAIKAAVAKVASMVKSFLVGLLKNRKLLVSHLEGLKKKVGELDDALVQKEAKLKGGYAAAFTVEGKASEGTALQVLESSAAAASAAKAVANIASKQAAGLISGDAAKSKAALAKFGDLVESEVSKLGSVNFSGNQTVEGAKYFGRLAGGMSVGLVNGETMGVQVTMNTKELAKEIDALDKGGMAKIIDKAIAAAKALQENEAMQKDLDAVTAACNKASEAVIRGAANAEKDADAKAAYAQEAKNVRTLNALVAKFGGSLPGVVFKAAKAGGDYVSASLSNYKPKAEEKKEEVKAE